MAQKVLINGDKVLTFSNAVAKKWVINEHANTGMAIRWWHVNFQSKGSQFSQFEIWWDPAEINFSRFGRSITVATGTQESEIDTWVDQAYRTVEFETEPSGDLLTWLQANAVPVQEGSSKVLVADVASAF